MSSEVHCDVCKAVGRRRMMTYAPTGWFYAESWYETDEFGKDDFIIVLACSEECKQKFWKPGPGKMDPDEVLKADFK